MPLYECVFIARQDISGTQMEGLIETFSNLIVEQGGQVPKKEYWGLKNLAYRIKKNRKGHYALLNLDAPPAAVQEMERTMKINEDVLRFLTVRVDELEEGPSAVMQGRGNREDRPRRAFGDRPFGDRGDRPFGDRGDRPSGGERPAGDGRALAGAIE